MSTHPTWNLRPLLAALALLTLVACGDDPAPTPEPIDEARLTELLAAASPGDTITLGGEIFTGHFEVPGGVQVVGNGARFVGVDGGAVFVVEGGSAEAPTRLSDLTVLNEGLGLLAHGRGHVALEDVTVEVRALGGVFAEDLDAFTMRRVHLQGSLTPDNVGLLLESSGGAPDPCQFPVAGLLMSKVGAFEGDELTVSGFAGFGAIFVESGGVWSQGGVSQWVGTGVLVEGGQMTLTEVEVAGSLNDPGLQLAPNGVAVTRGGHLESGRLTIQGVAGIGLLQDDASSAHTALNVTSNARAGIWVQNTVDPMGRPALRLGPDSVVADNFGLGLYMRDFDGLHLDRATISGTRLREQLVGELGRVSLGDGLQMVGVSGLVRMDNARFTANARVGWLIDGTGAGSADFEGSVRVERGALELQTEPYGVIAQRGAEPWLARFDALIERPDFERVDARAAIEGLTLDVVPPFAPPNSAASGPLTPQRLVCP